MTELKPNSSVLSQLKDNHNNTDIKIGNMPNIPEEDQLEEEITAKVIKAVTHQAQLHSKSSTQTTTKIDLETNLRDGLALDSLDSVELVMALEVDCGVHIEDDAASQFKKIKDIVQYIKETKLKQVKTA